MEIFTQSPALDRALVDPANWADEQWVHDQFAWLRKNAPLQQLAPEGYAPFWNVTRYDHIKEIEGQKQLFINDPRPTLGLEVMQQMVQQMTGRKHLVRSLVQMDDPDHMKYRMLTQGWFMGSNLRKLQARVDELADKYIDRMADMGGECDFVKDVAIWYPLRVIMSIFGVPEEDEPLMLKLTQELFGSTDPDVNRSFEPTEFLNVVKDFEDYFVKLSEARRADPKDDLATIIANAQIDGAQIPEHEANGAGKTSLIEILSGRYKQKTGDVIYKDQIINNKPLYERARMGIGRTYQTPVVPEELTVGETLKAARQSTKPYLPVTDAEYAADLVKFKVNWDTDNTKLETFNRRKLLMTSVLMREPEIILMDEPASGLINAEIDEIDNTLRMLSKEMNIAVIIVEHRIELLETIADRVVVMDAGEIIAEGNLEDVVNNPKVKEAYFEG